MIVLNHYITVHFWEPIQWVLKVTGRWFQQDHIICKKQWWDAQTTVLQPIPTARLHLDILSINITGLVTKRGGLHPTEIKLTGCWERRLFTSIWKGKRIQNDWSKFLILKIPKKGSLKNCDNWRGITLLSIPSKILAKVIIQRISDAIDKQLRRE